MSTRLWIYPNKSTLIQAQKNFYQEVAAEEVSPFCSILDINGTLMQVVVEVQGQADTLSKENSNHHYK